MVINHLLNGMILQVWAPTYNRIRGPVIQGTSIDLNAKYCEIYGGEVPIVLGEGLL